MKSLIEYITEAGEAKRAVGHFNISNIEGFWAVTNAAKNLNLPVIIGVSEGERDFIGVKQVKALVDTLKTEGRPVFLNADHTYSLERIKEVVDAGYDSVIIDEADKGFEENLKTTEDAVAYVAKATAENSDHDILVEAELGFIGKSSKMIDEVPAGMKMTEVAEAVNFVNRTGIDLFAPSVGNVHGIVKGGAEPRLDIERIRQIKEAVKIPLVLHGASGNSEADLRAAIEAGISIVHINTEVRLAYRHGLQKSLSENPDEVAPYKILKEAVKEMQVVVEKKLYIFAGL